MITKIVPQIIDFRQFSSIVICVLTHSLTCMQQPNKMSDQDMHHESDVTLVISDVATLVP